MDYSKIHVLRYKSLQSGYVGGRRFFLINPLALPSGYILGIFLWIVGWHSDFLMINCEVIMMWSFSVLSSKLFLWLYVSIWHRLLVYLVVNHWNISFSWLMYSMHWKWIWWIWIKSRWYNRLYILLKFQSVVWSHRLMTMLSVCTGKQQNKLFG